MYKKFYIRHTTCHIIIFIFIHFQNELTTKGHEVIALKSEIRDLLQKLESKERRIDEIEGRRPERRDSDNGGDGNCCDDQLAADKLCSLVGRLNEQVSC